MCHYISYPQPIDIALNARYTKLSSSFVQMWDHKEDYGYEDWVHIKSDLLCEICYFDEFKSFKPELVQRLQADLERYVTMIETTYKI